MIQGIPITNCREDYVMLKNNFLRVASAALLLVCICIIGGAQSGD